MWEILILRFFFLQNFKFFKNLLLILSIIFLAILKSRGFSIRKNFWVIDPINLFLIFLTAIIIFFCFVVKTKKAILVLITRLKLFFIRKKIVLFYIFFEFSIIPAFYLIFSQGNKPERIKALYFLIVYTILGSFPLIFFLLQNIKIFKKFFILFLKFSVLRINLRFVSVFFLVFAFFIKLPLFGLHRWLPKAHVEAPTAGSMILAALLLKMGSFGLYRLYLRPLVRKFKRVLIAWLLICLIIVGFICFRISDIKMLIAFSSINHMLVVAFRWVLFSFQKLYFSVLLRVSHGFIRRGLFLIVGSMYQKSSSRNIFFKTRVNKRLSLSALFWFALIAANCSAPTSISLFSEIYIFGHMRKNIFSLIRIFFFVFFSGLYCIYLYMISFHGDYNSRVKKTFYKSHFNLIRLLHICFCFFLVFFIFLLF